MISRWIFAETRDASPYYQFIAGYADFDDTILLSTDSAYIMQGSPVIRAM